MNSMKNNRFGKEHRLRIKADFLYLRHDSMSVKSPLLRVVYKKTRVSGTLTRVGFAVSKRCGKAATRNRVKRLLKEYFRQSGYKELGMDCLFIIQCRKFKELVNKPERESLLQTCFNDCFEKIVTTDC